jgi:F420-non-reducing hydrogenase iron-sulfur subunit
MAEPACPDVILYVCTNCIPEGGHVPRQWMQGDVHVLLRIVPCSGKTDGQYLLHALEGGARGVGVVACPRGQCRFAEGNYRAEVRIGTIRRLLGEIGLEPERLELVHWSKDDPFDQFQELMRDVAGRIRALGESPVRAQPRGANVGL